MPALGLISPVTAHEEADSKSSNRHENVRHNSWRPRFILMPYQRRDGIRERDQQRGKPEEDGRWMNGHPDILQGWIQAFTKVWRPRQIHGISVCSTPGQ